MIVAPPPHGPAAPAFGSLTRDCVSRFAEYYSARSLSGHPLPRIAVSRDRPFALVALEFGAGGQMDLFRRRGAAGCRIEGAHQSIDVGGISIPDPWLHEFDIAGLDDVGRLRARRMFRATFVAETSRAR